MFLDKILKKKVQQSPKTTDWGTISAEFQQNIEENIYEPKTLARYRLENGAQDIGFEKGVRMYNSHCQKVNNQWVNAFQSINTGFGTSQLSGFNYQTVNYYECYALAQDPLFTNIFNILSEEPFSKGGRLDGINDDEWDKVKKNAVRINLIKEFKNAVRSSWISGGCLLYMDFGIKKLDEPLDLKKQDLTQFKGFKHIDPINCVAVEVNTTDPSAEDYMEPKKWYVIGLGVVDRSHFLKFEQNIPELVMKPLCLYFGMPLTQLIKQDVANSNLSSQGLANLINRFRMTYLKSTDNNYWTAETAQNFKNRLEAISYLQDNFSVFPLKAEEDIIQLTTSLAGMSDCLKSINQNVSAKTGIVYTKLFGTSAEGLNATGEGDRINNYDKIRTIQESIKSNLLIAYGIAGGLEDGEFKEYDGYTFNSLEIPSDREVAENLRSYTEVAKSLIELGIDAESIVEWLKTKKVLGLDAIKIDINTQGLEDYENESFAIVNNEDPKEWITVKDNHLPVDKGKKK